MCHAWITHWTVARAVLTMSRRRSTRDERTHGRDAREPLLAHASLFGASGARFWIVTRATSVRIEEPSMVSILYIKSSVPDTYK